MAAFLCQIVAARDMRDAPSVTIGCSQNRHSPVRQHRVSVERPVLSFCWCTLRRPRSVVVSLRQLPLFQLSFFRVRVVLRQHGPFLFLLFVVRDSILFPFSVFVQGFQKGRR